MKKNKTIYNEIEFDSKEELEFYWWCEEAQEKKLIDYFLYHPEPFLLSHKATFKIAKPLKTKMKIVDKHLFHSHEYTPDFLIRTYSDIEGLQRYGHAHYYIEVKGGYSIYNNHREFSINQKWVWQRWERYINKVEPAKFFKLNWVPDRAILTEKTKKVRKCYVGYSDKNGEIIK